jgi:hypothetical protein
MVYDSHRQRTVVFGGRAGTEFRTDTWELDRTGWKKLADGGPPPRILFGMAYDPRQKQAIIVGGSRAVARPVAGDILDDVWTWDGVRWQQIPGGPGARDHTAAAYDPVGESVMVVAGARAPGGPLGDSWSWSGGRWTPIPIGAVGARAGHALATDVGNRRIFLYGGFLESAPARELWEYTASGWRRAW